VSCGESSDVEFIAFDLNLGGVVCRSCRSGVAISSSALGLMRDVLGGKLGESLDRAFNPDGQQLNDPVINEVSQLATRAFEHHIERRLRSVSIFERH
jgi:DNA repair protein RecO (recombination protein O)